MDWLIGISVIAAIILFVIIQVGDGGELSQWLSEDDDDNGWKDQ